MQEKLTAEEESWESLIEEYPFPSLDSDIILQNDAQEEVKPIDQLIIV
jgi:hypothetical protein